MTKTSAAVLLSAALAVPALSQTLSPLAKAKTVQVTHTQMSTQFHAGVLQPDTVTVIKLARPNLWYVKTTPAVSWRSAEPYIYINDGKTAMEYRASSKQFRKADALSPNFLDALLNVFTFSASVKPASTTLDSKAVLLYVGREPYVGGFYTKKLWVDAATSLPVRQSRFFLRNGQTQEETRDTFSHWVLNAPLPLSTFQFTPPAGAKEAPTQP